MFGKKKAAPIGPVDEKNKVEIICPFCGNVSTSKEFCTRCHTLFNKTVLKAAFTPENDPRSDYVGPFSTKTAKRLLYVGIVVLLVLFFVFTEMTGEGITSWGK
ncbi:MAG: hypothetical protein Q4C41_01585 [Eggerthellaceae bacterium]|nr:hypothetical protein [Eggerthellaceae bacterium]